MRKETDSLGTCCLDDASYYGIQTARAMDNFKISDDTFCRHRNIIDALVEVKKACARANEKAGALSEAFAGAIVFACDRLLAGGFYDQFPINTIRGCGTSINMNANEVIAHMANERLVGTKTGPIHPNTHVNMCQSSNDVFPTVMAIVCYRETGKLIQSLDSLIVTFKNKQKEIGKVVRLGRTCLQDAVPLTIGQHFSGCIQLLKRCRDQLRLHNRLPRRGLMGATAVGTGIGLFPSFRRHIYAELSHVAGFPLVAAANLFDGMQNSDELMTLSALLRNTASAYAKIAHDFLFLASGPACGIGNLVFSGKADPLAAACDSVRQISQLVLANDAAICLANQFTEPDIAPSAGVKFISLVESLALLPAAGELLGAVISATGANRELCERQANASMSLATIISTIRGYPAGVRLVKQAVETDSTCRDAAVRDGLCTKSEARKLFNIRTLTSLPGMERLIMQYSAQE